MTPSPRAWPSLGSSPAGPSARFRANAVALFLSPRGVLVLRRKAAATKAHDAGRDLTGAATARHARRAHRRQAGRDAVTRVIVRRGEGAARLRFLIGAALTTQGFVPDVVGAAALVTKRRAVRSARVALGHTLFTSGLREIARTTGRACPAIGTAATGGGAAARCRATAAARTAGAGARAARITTPCVIAACVRHARARVGSATANRRQVHVIGMQLRTASGRTSGVASNGHGRGPRGIELGGSPAGHHGCGPGRRRIDEVVVRHGAAGQQRAQRQDCQRGVAKLDG